MTVEFENNEASNTATLRIKGPFNFDINGDFRGALKSAADSKRKVIVDLSMVNEIDSSALGMLLLLREQCGTNDKRVAIVKCRPDIYDILKMANFQTMFDIDGL